MLGIVYRKCSLHFRLILSALTLLMVEFLCVRSLYTFLGEVDAELGKIFLQGVGTIRSLLFVP